MTMTISVSHSPISSQAVQQPQTQEPKKQEAKAGGSGFWDGVARFFQLLFGARPVVLSSKQKLLVGPTGKDNNLDKIPDRMWKAVGMKKAPKTTDSSLVRLSQTEAKELLTNAKLYTVIGKANFINPKDAPPQQPEGWCNLLDKSHQGDYGVAPNDDDVKNMHKLGMEMGVLSKEKQQKLEKELPLDKKSLNVLNQLNGKYEACLKLSQNPKIKTDSEMQENLKQLMDEYVDLLDNYPFEGLKKALCDPLGQNQKIKGGLLPSDFKTKFEIKNGLIMDSKTGLTASISFNPTTREMAVGFTGNAVIDKLSDVNKKNSLDAVLGGVPSNFKQADQLVASLKKHIDTLNENLKQQKPPGEPLKLRLNGYCMGGGMAAYAGGKNKVVFNSFNPMPLGLGLQKDMGKEALKWANENGNRYISESDRISDQNASSLLKTGMSLLKCQTPGKAMIVPREYVTRTQTKDGKEVQAQDVHPLSRHMIENLASGTTFKKA